MSQPPSPELTVRGVVTGMIVGAILTPCNVYSGLKIGWTFNMSIAAALIGLGVWRVAERLAGARPWEIKENAIAQTTASSSASIISGGLVAPIPALTILTGQTLSWPVMSVWVFVVSILGVVVAAGLRQQMLFRENLPFPSGVATAETLREIHAEGREAAMRLRTLLAGAAASAGLKLADAVVGLTRLAPPVALPATGALKAGGASSVSATNLTFVLDPSLLMVGFGAIIGLRVGLSMLIGAIVAWGILSPLILAWGWVPPGPDDPSVAWFGPLVDWLLWPGVAMMVVSTLTSFAISLGQMIRGAGKRGQPGAAVSGPPEATLPKRAFLFGIVATLIMATAAQTTIFGIGLWEAIFAVAMAYLLAVVSSRVTGETGIPPIGALGKITQLTYGVVSPGNITANLMSANVTGGAAGQSSDLLHDLRAGSMLGVTPRFQIIAQVFGVLTGSLVGTLVYLTLVPDPAAMLLTPEWPAPAVAVWKSVAEVLAEGLDTIPEGAVTAMIIGAGLGVLMGVAEKLLPERIAQRLPSAPAAGLAFVIPAWNSISLFLGALAAAVLRKVAPEWSERRLIALAAGLIAGESLFGIGLAAAGLLN